MLTREEDITSKLLSLVDRYISLSFLLRMYIYFDSYLDSEYNELFQSVIQTSIYMSYHMFLFASIHYNNHAILVLYIYVCVDDDRFHTLSIYLRVSHRRI